MMGTYWTDYIPIVAGLAISILFVVYWPSVVSVICAILLVAVSVWATSALRDISKRGP